MTEREVFKKYGNLSENELNSKKNKDIYISNDVISSVIVHWWSEEKRTKNTGEFRKKIEFTEFLIMLLSEYSIKSKIRKMFASEKTFEEYYVKIYEIDPYFSKNYKKKKSW